MVNGNIISKVDAIIHPLKLNHEDYLKDGHLLNNELNRGLKSTKDSSVKMYLTYVRSLPNQKERGVYLALDLGGTNIRVVLIEFLPNKINVIDQQCHEIPATLFFSSGSQLFDFIAENVIQFAIKNKLAGVRVALGFTFSFPSVQHGLAEATLVAWTKNFMCPGVVGYDVVQLLKQSLKRKMDRSIPYIDVVAIINDTTGTLIYGSLKDSNCKIGLIVGTGSNCCYVEQLQNIDKWPYNYSEPNQVIINCECGAFGDNGVLDCLATSWDRTIDYESLNITKQIHEKIIAGMYLPELLRRIMLTLVEKGLLFNGLAPIELFVPYSIKTKFMSLIDLDDGRKDLTNTKEALKKIFKYFKCNETDLRIIFSINNTITRRSAYFVATALWTLAKRIDQVNVSVAYDGSLICKHPHYKRWVKEKVNEFAQNEGIEKVIGFVEAPDGSIYGAAIVAAICYREKRPKFIKKNGKVYEITRF